MVSGWLEFQDPFGWQLQMAGCLLLIFCLPELCQAQSPPPETTCLGAHCFKLAFFIMAVVCLVGVFINLTLAARTRNLYQSLHKLHSSTTTFSDDDDDGYNCEDKCDSDPILPH
ncbi:unnamed protein product [Sphagnum tenellum]